MPDSSEKSGYLSVPFSLTPLNTQISGSGLDLTSLSQLNLPGREPKPEILTSDLRPEIGTYDPDHQAEHPVDIKAFAEAYLEASKAVACGFKSQVEPKIGEVPDIDSGRARIVGLHMKESVLPGDVLGQQDINIQKIIETYGNLQQDGTQYFGERTLDLAAKGWYFATNQNNTPEEIRSGIEYAISSGGYEPLVERVAYGFRDRIDPNMVAIYAKGDAVKNISAELRYEVGLYAKKRRRSAEKALHFLLGFYKDVVTGGHGSYAQRFNAGDKVVAQLAVYFAEKLRGFGRVHEATRQEAFAKMKFPPLEDAISHAFELHPESLKSDTGSLVPEAPLKFRQEWLSGTGKRGWR